MRTETSKNVIQDRKRVYYHCHRCQQSASTSCLAHKQLIEIFLGSEIDKISQRRRFECGFCLKIGFATTEKAICSFCHSDNIHFI